MAPARVARLCHATQPANRGCRAAGYRGEHSANQLSQAGLGCVPGGRFRCSMASIGSQRRVHLKRKAVNRLSLTPRNLATPDLSAGGWAYTEPSQDPRVEIPAGLTWTARPP